MSCLNDSFSSFNEIMLGLLVNLVTVMHEERSFYCLEEALLPDDAKKNDDHIGGKDWNFLGYWNSLTFKPAKLMMDLGVSKQLDFQDLVQLPSELMPSSCHIKLLNCWLNEQSKYSTSPSLFRAIFSAYGWPYLRLGALKILNDTVGFVGPLLLNRLIRFLQQGSGHRDGYILAVALGLTSIIKSFLDTQYSFHLTKLKLTLRSSIMTIIYHKCLQVSLAERSKFSEGEIQTFMSVDADRTINVCNSFHDMWSLPLQIGVALYLLYTQVKFAFVSGTAITVLLIPVNKWISTLIAGATEKMMQQKDERIRSAGEIITFIRTLKMYGWELLFANRLLEKRSQEVKHLSTRKYLDAWCVFFWATTPTLFSLFTFGLFSWMGHQLDAATVFTCVALFNTLISPLNSFPWVINGLIDAIISARRLSNFLSCPEFKFKVEQVSAEVLHEADPLPISPFEGLNDTDLSQMDVIFKDARCVWSSRYHEAQNIILDNITLGIPKGCLIAVIGEVGSGKSSLLNSILGEMHLLYGSINCHGSIAYVPQVPWIMVGSVRDNILFGEEYCARRYADVLHACALDIDISLMVGGDLAYVGEKGVNLSGGQRSRLALARAVYQCSDIYFLDDVLSAVDAQVACWILEKAILGPLMNQKTRVLCTHNTQAISAADLIIVMEKGCIKWSGNLTNFMLTSYATISMPKDKYLMLSQRLEKRTSTNASRQLNSNDLIERDCTVGSAERPDVPEIEYRKEGRVELFVYKSYAMFCSWPVVTVICVSAAFMQASRNGNDLWLSYWVDTTSETNYSIRFYVVILSIFCAANSLLTLIRAFSFSYGGLQAAIHVHSMLLKKLIDAPVHFFDQNPSGRILNRMSSDLYTIDDSLPFILNILLANSFNLLGIAIVLSYAQVVFLILLLPFGYIYSKLQFYYRSTSRELRRLDSVSRSPIYASFTETINGSSTIRAFGKEELFMARFMQHVALYQQTSYSELIASLWLSLRLQLLAAFIVSCVALMAIIGCRNNLPVSFGTPGLVGLALSYAAPIVSLLSSFLTSFTETEKEMVSVERVIQYTDISQEDLLGCQAPHPDWPICGEIEFKHVTLRYKATAPAALNDISFNILAGTQVGIVGRTGAGKSSIINALFRLNPICHGRILVDDVDVSHIFIRDLRSCFAVVPQSPFLFEGSLRENLDPFGLTSDSKVWEVLEKCHIKEEIEVAGGLDVHVKESGTSFSVGQKQLICLARALLRSSKVLCLDECTANIDTPTASIIQNTISSECKGMTVLTIAHRISIVLNMDNVLVLDHGILVEQGNPQVLLKDDHSIFSSFARASTI
uniref:ABC-type xenobiotic transporter n=1 Tax=Anthurium amnicola TaxID=1678845 RepID=A0A1D1XUS0_9ARAE